MLDGNLLRLKLNMYVVSGGVDVHYIVKVSRICFFRKGQLGSSLISKFAEIGRFKKWHHLSEMEILLRSYELSFLSR